MSVRPKRDLRDHATHSSSDRPLNSSPERINYINMNKHFKMLLLIIAGTYLVLHYTQEDLRWRARIQNATAKQAQGKNAQANYDLTSMIIMNRAVVYIEDHYVEPERVNRPKMVASGLEEIQQTVPEIMVNLIEREDKTPTSAEIQVNDHRESFSLQVTSRFDLLFKFRDIFRFIKEHITHFDDLRAIEYAAINGMLSTLDPHSVLLTPEEYAEMHLNTRGRFGGLGIVIGIRDNHLTVINPIENTPAARAVVLANDHIVQINLDSTVNMSLSDAVNLMRGDPGTQVSIYIMRKGWKSPKKFVLTRDNIKVKSVKYKYLGNGIGMVRVRNFQNTTVNELKAALEILEVEAKDTKDKKLSGLVLDLRSNPGGLLDQAAKMSDLFIERGTLVKTVGSGDRLREPKMARSRGTIKDLPIVVMLDTHSASASEIVAGALKNHARALVIGQRSFGKGSVQLLFDNPDRSALKLTIAQYLTPGDISIQSVGITPTVELSPVLITDEDTYFYGLPDEAYGEASLPEHLESKKSAASKAQKPLMTLRYLRDPEVLKKQRDHPNQIIVDFETRFARDVLKQTRGHKLKQLTRAAEQLLNLAQTNQEAKIDETLKPRGIQWLSKATRARAQGRAQVKLSPENGEVRAGESIKITVTVTNTSKQALHRVRGITKSVNPLFKGHEFLFGHIPPGASRSWTEEIKVGASFSTRQDLIEVVFDASGRGRVEPLAFSAKVEALNEPHFALRYEIDDHKTGNGDGVPNPGEEVELILSFSNQGEGETRELVGQLSNEGKGKTPAIFIKRGRVTPEDQTLSPQEEGHVRFLFKVKEGWKDHELKAYLSVVDPKLRESTITKLNLAIYEADQITAQSGDLKAVQLDDALKHLTDVPSGPIFTLRAGPHPEAAVLAYLSQARTDGCIGSSERSCTWYRVPTQEGRYGWVKGDTVELNTEGVKPHPQPITLRYEVSPPQITIDKAPLSVSQDTTQVTISGKVESIEELRDLMIYVNQRKVFFLPRTEMEDPRGVSFSADVPLEEGVNHITIYARLSEEISDVASVFIYRPKDESKNNKDQKKDKR